MTAPLMVMVDYADAYADDLSAVLAVVKDRVGPPAVVIVTARSVEGDWLTDVTDVTDVTDASWLFSSRSASCRTTVACGDGFKRWTVAGWVVARYGFRTGTAAS